MKFKTFNSATGVKRPFRNRFTQIIFALVAAVCLVKSGDAKEAETTFQNPIIPGFYPDPSICRVGNDYYTVHSSFEYFPGVPIFHSQDLVHWEQIGYCLMRKSQLNLDHSRASGGIYAPTLRYHDGTFYMMTTRVDVGGNFFVTAKNPAGPWSDPIWVDSSGIDSSLFFDDDGTVYYTRHEGMGDGHIVLGKINMQNGKLDGDLKEIWKGTGGIWPEGPHLYKINGKYYLLIAEGGTSYDHRITIARSDSPWGPFEGDPQNPILSHRGQPENPIQALGHGDIVETPDGWWMVCLGIRPQGGKFHHLGRETYLTSFSWSEAGWPIVRDVALQMSAPHLPNHHWKEALSKDDFDGAQLGLQWNYIRNPDEHNYSLSERPGYLRLWGSAVTLNDQDSPTFIGRRQTDPACRVTTRMAFIPQHENEEAGLVLRGNDNNHFEIGIGLHKGERQIFLWQMLDGQPTEPVHYEKIGPGDVVLTVEATPLAYTLFYQLAHAAAKNLGTIPTRALSSEKIGGFTGVFMGLFATGNGQKNITPADFDWFDYSKEK